MPQAQASATAELQSSYPAFLAYLDSDPERAAEVFGDLCFRYLSVSPPKPLTWKTWVEAEDYFSEIIQAFLKNDFHKLRQYQDTGRPFIIWLRTSMDNLARDILRRINREEARTTSLDAAEENGPSRAPAASTPSDPLLQNHILQAIESFRGRHCYCLLVWRLLRGYTNQDIVRLLKLPSSQNRTVGNRYFECRNHLMQKLEGDGITADYFS